MYHTKNVKITFLFKSRNYSSAFCYEFTVISSTVIDGRVYYYYLTSSLYSFDLSLLQEDKYSYCIILNTFLHFFPDRQHKSYFRCIYCFDAEFAIDRMVVGSKSFENPALKFTQFFLCLTY